MLIFSFYSNDYSHNLCAFVGVLGHVNNGEWVSWYRHGGKERFTQNGVRNCGR
jgi:hypothetical protein